MNIPSVITSVVKNDMCIGCGLCVYKCPNHALEMKWNKFGFLVPELIEICDSTESCLSVCPFNPYPDKEIETENELGELFLNDTHRYHPKIGKYVNLYAGHANEFRLTSSSGGVATFILNELLDKGIVDHVFSVKESNKIGEYYEYSICSTIEELLTTSKTKYFPVTLGSVMPQIKKLKGNVAIVGVACFIKAIRLAQHHEPELKAKIPFLVGIICGGVKSRFFTEYLAAKAGVSATYIEKPQFRIKDLNSTAGDYSFACINKLNSKEHRIKMRTVGDMWGTGIFKNNACDFCDDVTTELADISLGDAWFSPYNSDGAGTNVIVTRSMIAEKIIQVGAKEGKLTIEPLPQDKFLVSQQGSYNHRHTGLSYRIKHAKRNKLPIPPKRFKNEKISIYFKFVQKLRMSIRKKSLSIWANHPDFIFFDLKIKNNLKILRLSTLIYHYNRKIKKIIRSIFSKQ